jgi:hypothetical protein
MLRELRQSFSDGSNIHAIIRHRDGPKTPREVPTEARLAEIRFLYARHQDRKLKVERAIVN